MLSVSHLLASGRHTKWRIKPLKNVVCVSLAPIRLQITVKRNGDQLDPQAIINAPATLHLLRTLHHVCDLLLFALNYPLRFDSMQSA